MKCALPHDLPRTAPRVAGLLSAVLATASLVACGADSGDASAISDRCDDPAFTAQSSSIALAPDGALWLTSPDDDRVHRINADTLQVEQSWSVVAGAHHLAISGDHVVITGALDTRLTMINRASGAQVFVDTPCGGTHAVVALDASGINFAFSCANDGEVLQFNADTRHTSPLSPATPALDSARPTAMAVSNCELGAGDQRGGVRVWTLGPSDASDGTSENLALSAFEARLPARASLPQSRISGLSSLVATDAGFVAVATRVDADGPRDLPVEDATYGSVIDGDPRIAPVVLGSCAGEYALFDGGDRVFSGPIAVAPAGEDELLIAHAWTHNVALVRCTDEQSEPLNSTLIASTGDGVRGMVTNDDATRVWLDVGYDYAVQRVDRTQDGWTSTVVRREPAENRYSPRAQQGRRLFQDATDQHLTPSGTVACATCHPEGGDDGLTWFLHTASIAPKVRRTPSAAVQTGARPLHWDGEFDSASTLTLTTIRGLMGGDALLIDPQNLAAYMEELPPLPGRPVAADTRDAVAAGRGIFEAGANAATPCADCHAGSALTDGEMHSVLQPALDSDARLDSVVTPSLHGVRARAPYFHDGRSMTLADAIGIHADAQSRPYGDSLTATQIEQLALYLATL